jgi:guanosine-3',5'-bis(diphosphate) 3'-pyrophosphohydrolase
MSGEASYQEWLRENMVESIDDLLNLIKEYFPGADLDYMRRAYEFSEKAHEGQIRRSGEPYISHPLGVAGILAELRLDMATVATGLLHDTVEDTDVTLEDIEKEFGEDVRHLVDGVTKISKMTFRNTHEKQGENIRKMIVAMGKDVRVVLVKLADRLHNMRTLNHMPPEKQSRIAKETLDIYSPLAGRLGISSIKVELEDLSFRYSQPESYYSLVQKVSKKKREREKYIEEVKRELTEEVANSLKTSFEISGRPKHLYSIFKKMQGRGIDYEQVYDVLAFRVSVSTVPECYEILGLIHNKWKPIPGRFKDFIAMPKANNYQSLHTTVIGPGAERIEIQIRTHEMHLVAEMGIAAHWKYKEASRGISEQGTAGDIDKFNWLRELVNMHQQTSSPDEFLENVKSDLFDSEIYVFTPKGEVKEFPDGATPIDFAYSVHTDVGNQIVAARINGKLVSLKQPLQNGDTIEIITSKNQTPNKDWLNYSVTTRAKTKIRQHVKAEQRKRALEIGKELLDKSIRKYGKSPQKFLSGPEYEQAAKDVGANSIDDIYIRVGYGAVTPKQVIEKIAPELSNQPSEEEKESTFLQRAFRSAASKTKKNKSMIKVDGMDDVLVRFAKCCNPIPGDSIVGFITLGRGIVIHTSECEKAFELDQDRRIDVDWNSSSKGNDNGRMVKIRVVSHDVSGLLKQMTEVFSSHGANIHNAEAKTTKDLKAVCIFDVSVHDTSHLHQVMSEISRLKGVLGVTRMTKS